MHRYRHPIHPRAKFKIVTITVITVILNFKSSSSLVNFARNAPSRMYASPCKIVQTPQISDNITEVFDITSINDPSQTVVKMTLIGDCVARSNACKHEHVQTGFSVCRMGASVSQTEKPVWRVLRVKAINFKFWAKHSYQIKWWLGFWARWDRSVEQND